MIRPSGGGLGWETPLFQGLSFLYVMNPSELSATSFDWSKLFSHYVLLNDEGKKQGAYLIDLNLLTGRPYSSVCDERR